ncbi:glycosyltransferase family 2 protein [Hymenobacter metallicola]|uniref:Glycosyltransferase family 2 protein n=1 Tax=Hymenobacter metallicola TaxID=2563114 RepID=A0A4Z0QEW2_9BACT|nr:glycosyltransferase family A protein [Hymenobacter metallicola]TGE28274.1 glycosyltransferase family 2 protein [Hymenobacter metallicola]
MMDVLQPPMVSVIMPVYNGGHFLRPAIESVLHQTFTDFELLIVDDCSSDGSRAVAQTYAADPRVRVFGMPENKGRAFCDNYAAQLARGRYIAKMDADDIALPQRLQTQVAFLEQHPEVDLTGSFLQCIGESRLVYEYPVSTDQIRSAVLFDMPVGNPSVFFRRSILREHGLSYDESLAQTEDYDFISRAAQKVTMVNQPEVLVQYRTQAAPVKAKILAARLAQANRIRERLLRDINIPFTRRELRVHNTVCSYPFRLGNLSLEEVHTWLWKLYVHTQVSTSLHSATMLKCIAERWFLTCYNNCSSSVRGLQTFYNFPLSREYPLGAKLRLKFWVKDLKARFAPPIPTVLSVQPVVERVRRKARLAGA